MTGMPPCSMPRLTAAATAKRIMPAGCGGYLRCRDWAAQGRNFAPR
jgi:hypothetical protein